MQNLKPLAAHALASYAAEAALNALGDTRVTNKLFRGPRVEVAGPGLPQRAVALRAAREAAVDAAVGALVGEPDYGRPLRALPRICADSLLGAALRALAAGRLPDRGTLRAAAERAVEAGVARPAEARAGYARPLGSLAWGFAGGFAADAAGRRLAGEPQDARASARRGAGAALAALVYGEVRALVMAGELW